MLHVSSKATLSFIALCLLPILAWSGGCTEQESSQPKDSGTSHDTTASIVAALEDSVGPVDDLSIEHHLDETSTPYSYAMSTAVALVPYESLEDTRALDRAAFILFDVMQGSAAETATLHVRVQAPKPTSRSGEAQEWLTGRMYTWDPEIDHPFAEPIHRKDTITVWTATNAIPGTTAYRGVSGSAEPIGVFRGIDEDSVSDMAGGEPLPELEPFDHLPAETEVRPNGLIFGFGLPLELDEYKANVEYTAAGTLGYTGADGRGRPLYDLTLYLPYGVPLEFVLRDAATDTESVIRPGESDPTEMVLKPETGLAQDFTFEFPQPGRYEVFLRIAANGNPARTKGVWIDVSD